MTAGSRGAGPAPVRGRQRYSGRAKGRANQTVLQRRYVIALLSALLLAALGCASEPGLDKEKFAGLDRTAQELKAMIASGRGCEVPDALLERLAAGTAVLKGRTASQAELDLLAAYTNLAAVTRDGLFLCRSRDHLTSFKFVPKGRIYMTQELDPIVERYDLPTERHVYKPTGVHWRSISTDAIGTVWKKAGVLIRHIEVMQKYS